MGTVYRAHQTKPVKRPVALKLIKLGMDSRAVLARFDAERQALALMDHPNIARVYDGGTTAAGQPFFVMELVSGVPITEYCDRERLSVRARLELFVSVCQAVQHAHQKGIIHRDLKPSNVLVTELDGRPTPKVIDFGVAKATEQRLANYSLADAGAIVGTPTYMSPEQADPSSMDIDTRTDVYALGVILYELLAGSPPIDAKQFQRGAFLEMLRMVREVDPPKPSTKLSRAEALPNIAASRDIEPEQLKRVLRGDLDWIVMKALEKDRARRYETANGFAADILRHLSHEPVMAAPQSRAYRARKFVRKHRAGVVAASLVVLALLAGIAGTTWGLVRAQRARAASMAWYSAPTTRGSPPQATTGRRGCGTRGPEPACCSSRDTRFP
jgi:eukaryotic-like serine/threonine-protein kinase